MEVPETAFHAHHHLLTAEGCAATVQLAFLSSGSGSDFLQAKLVGFVHRILWHNGQHNKGEIIVFTFFLLSGKEKEMVFQRAIK